MKILLFIIVVVVIIEFAQYWQIIKLLILNPFRKSKHVICSVNDIPKSMQGQLVAGIKELEALGFKVSHFIKHQEFYASIQSPKYAVVLFHPKHKCYAELENNMNPDAIRPFKVVFMQYYKDKTLMGFYAEAFSIVKGYQYFHCFDNNDINFKTRFANFLADVCNKEKLMKLGEKLVLDKQQCTKRANMLAVGYVDFLLEKQYVSEKNETYFFRFVPSIKLAINIKKKLASITKNELKAKELLNQHPKYIKAPEVDAYLRNEKILNHPTFNKWVKTLLFIISAILFVMLFGFAFDFSFALFLLPVLIFHEMGHLLAMKIFGYNDLQVLFMPFGAVAIGKEKTNTSALKKVIIYLAGPLPGILLALGLAYFPSVFEIPWVPSLVFLLVVINYFNLLPFMPLDGGQIINHVLFGRYPIFQFIFFLVSVIIFAVVAYLMEDFILGGFAIFLSIGLMIQFSNIKILRALSKEKFKNKAQLVAKIFYQLENKPLRFANKQQKTSSLVPVLMQPKAKLYEIVLGLLLYFSAFFAPLYIVNLHTDGLLSMVYSASITGSEGYDEKWTPAYWRQEVEKQKTAEEKFAIFSQMLNFTKGNFSPPFKLLLQDALKIAKENGFTNNSQYPTLLKANILLIWSELELLEIDEKLLNELAKIDSGTNIEYANTLLMLYTYGYEHNAIENLLTAQKIFKLHKQKNQNIMVLYSLATAYERNEDYINTENIYIKLSQITESNNDYSTQLIEFYTRRQHYTKALNLCEKAIAKVTAERIRIASFYQTSCAWIALLDKKHQRAKDYFTLSYEAEKKRLSQLSYDSKEMLSTFTFQHHQNMMALEWSKGDITKAKNHLFELETIGEKNKYLDIDENIKILRENPNTEFSKPDLKTKLIVNAYDGLKGTSIN